jgi:hypothetical protein
MTHVNLDTPFPTGQGNSIYDLLRKIVEKNPHAGKGKIVRLYCEALEEEDLIESFVSEFFEEARLRAFPPKPAKRKRSTKAQMQELIRKRISRAIFSFVMPNGKTLGDCTFGEIAPYGGSLSRLSTMGQPDQIIRQTLKQKEVKKVLLG